MNKFDNYFLKKVLSDAHNAYEKGDFKKTLKFIDIYRNYAKSDGKVVPTKELDDLERNAYQSAIYLEHEASKEPSRNPFFFKDRYDNAKELKKKAEASGYDIDFPDFNRSNTDVDDVHCNKIKDSEIITTNDVPASSDKHSSDKYDFTLIEAFGRKKRKLRDIFKKQKSDNTPPDEYLTTLRDVENIVKKSRTKPKK